MVRAVELLSASPSSYYGLILPVLDPMTAARLFLLLLLLLLP